MAKKSKRKVSTRPKRKPLTFSYCTACGCRMKINGICRICGDGKKSDI